MDIRASQSAIHMHDIMIRKGCHVDASITQSKTRPAYEVVSDRQERDDESDVQAAMRIIEVTQSGVDSEARWARKGGQSVLGYKQHTVVDGSGLVMSITTTADKAYSNRKHRDALR